ncbi:MAG: hypothetical protein ACI92N_003439, partial [Pseudomonadales bacterium]
HRFDFELNAIPLGLLPRNHLRHRSSPVAELSMRVY